MNPETMEQARALLLAVEHRMYSVNSHAEVVICPPAIFLAPFYHHVHQVKLGAQNVAWAEAGAFTGEISAAQLKGRGVEYVILGHSERRLYFGETDKDVNRKVAAILKHHIRPVICLGGEEKAKMQDMKKVVNKQFNAAVKGFNRDQIGKIVFAYEPFWAISTMKNSFPATGEHAAQLISHIRNLLAKKVGKGHAAHMKILYGGTVNKANVHEFASFPEIDGALVGGASLDAENFWEIMKEFARESIHRKT